MSSLSALNLSRAVMTLMLDSMVRGMIVLLLAGAVVCFLKQTRATIRHRLWLLAIVVTALMPLLIMTPGWRVLPAMPIVADAPRESLFTTDSESADAKSSPAASTATAPTHEVPQTPLAHQPIGQTLIEIVTVAWALGAAVMGGRLLLSRLTLSQLLRRAMPAPDPLQELCRASQMQLSQNRQVRLLQSTDATIMPMTWGLLRPTILLPASASQWPLSRQRVVMLHELSHINRFDYAWICVAELISAIYWFNPLWRWALNQLRDEAEQACDESVLAAGEDRCAYADELLATVKGYVRHRRATALALGMSRCSTLEARLKSILLSEHSIRPSRKRALFLFVVVLAVAAPLSQIRLEAQSRPAKVAATTTSAVTATTAPATRGVEVTYGGTLQDTDGKPIPKAKLQTLWAVPNRLGEFPKVATTDAAGIWTVSVDSSWTLQHIMGAEPGYVRLLVTKPDHDLLAAKTLALTMERSVTITGYVRDEQMQPIVGALITPPPTWKSVMHGRGQDPAQIYSGADGKFTVDGLSEGNMLLYITAEAFAPALVTPKRPDRAVIEMLSKGVELSGIVLDLDKKPLPNATVTLKDWRYKGTHQFTRTATTDQSGRFVIRHLPQEGDFWLQVAGPDLLSVRMRVTARENPPYEVQIIRKAKAHIEVVDDATGKPVTSFQYSVSEPVVDSDAIRFADFLHTTLESQDGKFDVEPRTRNIYSADQPFRIRVTADNYIPEDSPVFKVNSESHFTIRMKPAKYLSGSVVNADGAPVSNVQVAWVRPERHAFINVGGTLETSYNDSPDSIVKSDAAGHFSNLKITSESGNVVAICANGFAVLSGDAFASGGKLTLKPWASLSGRFLRQDKPMVNQRLSLRSEDPASIFWVELGTTVGLDGSFSFRRVPAATVKLSTSYEGHSLSQTIDLKSGQTARHDFFRND